MITVVVKAKTMVAENVCHLVLEPMDGSTLPRWEPGAHIQLQLTPDINRSYSLCGALNASHYEIAVLRDPMSRGGSSFVHDKLNLNSELQISEPKNLFPLNSQINPCVFFAAGIGITPIIPMIERCMNEGRSTVLYYCARTPSEAAFLHQLQVTMPTDALHVHFTQEHEGKRLDIPTCFKHITHESHVYVCGPSRFIDDVMANGKRIGLPEPQLHTEYFAAMHHETSADHEFEVQLASSGAIYTVSQDESILSTLEDNDIFIPVSCEEGICGTCVIGLVEGEADHRDVYLSDEEKASMKHITPCCSRARSKRLVLDI